MDGVVKTRLESLRFGEAQVCGNITILPVLAPAEGSLQYCTLGEALADWDMAITEVSAAGSVTELMVIYRGTKPVLLVDGEELAGAKQNRVLNTSILLQELSETRIPVSCTEQGRWSYASKSFGESGNFLAYRSRSKKTRSVHSSLEARGAYLSDQGEIWHEIAELLAQAGTTSPTSAMSDVYRAREAELRECDDAFKVMPNQVGLFAIIHGRPAGMEVVSLASAYARLHRKLVHSYTLEALLFPPRRGKRGQGARSSLVGAGEGGGGPEKPAPEGSVAEPLALAQSFLAEISSAEERLFASVGHGTDFPYKTKALSGSALVHQDELIHAAFFRADETG